MEKQNKIKKYLNSNLFKRHVKIWNLKLNKHTIILNSKNDKKTRA